MPLEHYFVWIIFSASVHRQCDQSQDQSCWLMRENRPGSQERRRERKAVSGFLLVFTSFYHVSFVPQNIRRTEYSSTVSVFRREIQFLSFFVIHIQAKPSVKRVRLFSDILAPLSRETKLNMRFQE